MVNLLLPAPGGAPRLCYGWDGTDWRALLVDAAGNLQIDVVTAPATAVTIADGADVTQGAIADAVVAAGAAGTVSAKLRRLTTDLDALLTELKLKADLTETQPVSLAAAPSTVVTIADGADVAEGAVADAVVAAGAVGTVSAKLRRLTTDLDALLTELKLKADLTETQPVSAAALPLPLGAATAAHQVTMITALQLIDDLRNALQSVHADELNIVKTGVPWVQRVTSDTGAADRSLDMTGVGPGWVYVLTRVSMWNDNNPTSREGIYANVSGAWNRLAEVVPSVQFMGCSWAGEVYLAAGDYVRGQFIGGTIDDDLYFDVGGYKYEV